MKEPIDFLRSIPGMDRSWLEDGPDRLGSRIASLLSFGRLDWDHSAGERWAVVIDEKGVAALLHHKKPCLFIRRGVEVDLPEWVDAAEFDEFDDPLIDISAEEFIGLFPDASRPVERPISLRELYGCTV